MRSVLVWGGKLPMICKGVFALVVWEGVECLITCGPERAGAGRIVGTEADRGHGGGDGCSWACRCHS